MKVLGSERTHTSEEILGSKETSGFLVVVFFWGWVGSWAPQRPFLVLVGAQSLKDLAGVRLLFHPELHVGLATPMFWKDPAQGISGDLLDI